MAILGREKPVVPHQVGFYLASGTRPPAAELIQLFAADAI
jgi:hypothetical protein